jgi:predicted Zn-dependent protease
MILAGRGKDHFELALKLLKINERQGEPTVFEKRARAYVQASQAASRREGLHTLEDLSRSEPLLVEEKYRLAHLYELEQDWGRAATQLAELLKLEPRNPSYLAGYVHILIKQKKLAQARSWLTRLEKVEPDSSRTKDLKTILRK